MTANIEALSSLQHLPEQVRVTEIQAGDFVDLTSDDDETVHAEVLNVSDSGNGFARIEYYETETDGHPPVEVMLCDSRSEFPVWR